MSRVVEKPVWQTHCHIFHELLENELPFDSSEREIEDDRNGTGVPLEYKLHDKEGPEVKRRRFFMEGRNDGVEIDGTGRGLKSGIVMDGGRKKTSTNEKKKLAFAFADSDDIKLTKGCSRFLIAYFKH